jgi:hypothetical protein
MRLKTTNEVTIKSTSKWSLITICNYELYQTRATASDQQNVQQETSDRPSSDQQATTNKNLKNGDNGNNKEKREQIPASDSNASVTHSNGVNEGKKRSLFQPPSLQEVEEYVSGKGYKFDPEEFVAFYTAKGWLIGKSKMKDWRAACTTWHKRWVQDHPQGSSGEFDHIPGVE